MASSSADVIVIGAGPAGYVCAIRLAQYGKKVIVVERAHVGGTCLNVGCIPSKAMIIAGNLIDRIRHAATMGITVTGVKLDLAKLVTWKQTVVDRLTGGIAMLFKNHGIESITGTARLTGPKQVEVDTAEGKRTLTAAHIVVATGSTPIEIPGFAFGDRVWSSTEALAPPFHPQRMVVIGGGYIGLELGMMYAKIGTKVTVVEAMEHILPGIDRELSKVVEKSLKKLDIETHVKAFAKGHETKADGSLAVSVEVNGALQTIDCDVVLSSVGRKPAGHGVGLQEVGVQMTERGFVEVDDQRRTSVPSIFAIGDIAGQPMLAHKGSKEGLVVADVIAGKNTVYEPRCIPAVIFTEPEVASVGLTEAEAREKGIEVKVGKFPFAASGRAISLDATEGFTKIVLDAKDDTVLGVHMVGPEVTELIAEAGLAIEMGATAEDLALTVHAHPTLPETLMEAAEAAHGLAIHIYQRKR